MSLDLSCPTCGARYASSAAHCQACGVAVGEAGPIEALPGGTMLNGGEFRLEKVLGRGGFGITYLGSDTRLQRPIAVKEFFPQGCVRYGKEVRPSGAIHTGDFHRLLESFIQEARMLAKFHHPGIVRVFTAFQENQTAYMVMEYVPGRPLSVLLNERGSLPEAEAVDYVRKVGAALEEVHGARLLHRDIKPENILLADDGRIVLIDFGSARAFASASTQRMTAMLTPGYAPLEQYSQHARFAPPTDVYGLAATLYHLLTGVMPVQATDRAGGEVLQPPCSKSPGISRIISAAVMQALEVRTADRPQSVGEFLRLLNSTTVPTQPRRGAPSGAVSFKFKSGEALTLLELADLCERYDDEAEAYLYDGYIEKWLAGSHGNPALARAARTATATAPRDRSRGRELILRSLYEQAGADPYPKVAVRPSRIDLGDLPGGARAFQFIYVSHIGRGYAWGRAEVGSDLQGASVTESFDTRSGVLEVSVDTTELPPGTYSGDVVIRGEGLPTTALLPVTYCVLPTVVQLNPAALDLGEVPYGHSLRKAIECSTAPAGGRMLGSVQVRDRECGIESTGTISGETCRLEVTLETKGLVAGRAYSTVLDVDTNLGVYELPIQFRVMMPWTTAAFWTGGMALLGAAVAWAVRASLASASTQFGHWFLAVPEQPSSGTMVASGVFAAVLAGLLVAANKAQIQSLRQHRD